MENVDIPTENAHEPSEQANQVQNSSITCHMKKTNKNEYRIKFAENTENTDSQKYNSYKDVLSQPAAGLSHRQKLLWLQKRRTLGIWAQCEDCERWRYLPDFLDSSELPQKWYCHMNTDKALASCSAPETPIHIREEEDLIHSIYSAGSVVWARLNGWPWWPAMVDDCPDVEQFYWLDGFSDIPTHYNVVFFDTHDVTRAWIAPGQLKPYNSNRSIFKHVRAKRYKDRFEAAITQADDALKLPLSDRLEKYSFLARYKGHIPSPKRVRQQDLLKYQKIFKRKFSVEFPIESSSDSEDDKMLRKKTVLNTKSQNKKQPRVRNVNKKYHKTIKKQTIPKNEANKEICDSEKSNNEPDSVAVLVGSGNNTSLTSTSNGNDASTNVSVSKTTIESSQPDPQLVSKQNASSSSDDFDFL